MNSCFVFSIVSYMIGRSTFFVIEVLELAQQLWPVAINWCSLGWADKVVDRKHSVYEQELLNRCWPPSPATCLAMPKNLWKWWQQISQCRNKKGLLVYLKRVLSKISQQHIPKTWGQKVFNWCDGTEQGYSQCFTRGFREEADLPLLRQTLNVLTTAVQPCHVLFQCLEYNRMLAPAQYIKQNNYGT